MKNQELKRRAIQLSYEKKLSHLSSVLTSIDIIKEIYERVWDSLDKDKFVLSNGHAGLALYVVLESMYPRVDAKKFIELCGTHPTRSSETEEFIDCSTGSLGQGLPIAVGIALADRNRNVYCLVSDGECAEGSIWEALRIAHDLRLNNLKVYANINGQTACKYIDGANLADRLRMFYPDIHIRYTDVDQYPHLKDMPIRNHYQILDDAMYKDIMEVFK